MGSVMGIPADGVGKASNERFGMNGQKQCRDTAISIPVLNTGPVQLDQRQLE